MPFRRIFHCTCINRIGFHNSRHHNEQFGARGRKARCTGEDGENAAQFPQRAHESPKSPLIERSRCIQSSRANLLTATVSIAVPHTPASRAATLVVSLPDQSAT